MGLMTQLRRRSALSRLGFFLLVLFTFYILFFSDSAPIDGEDETVIYRPPSKRELEKPQEHKPGDGRVVLVNEADADPSAEKVQVVYAFGRDYIVPAFVAVNSTLANTKHPSRLVIHLLVESMIASRVKKAFTRAFGTVADVVSSLSDLADESHVQARGGPSDDDAWGQDDREKVAEFQRHRRALPSIRPRINIMPFDPASVPAIKVWQGPQNLNNPLNFARFQLTSLFPTLEKLIYIDPDVVVQGDLCDMWDGHLKDSRYALAAVPSTRQETYAKFIIDYEATRVDKNEVYFNAGVMVLNLKIWKEKNKDAEIAKWLDLNRQRPIYKFGSQPPLLLAFYRDYEQMDYTWNYRHLGHKVGLPIDKIAQAKILHFNGPRKPWRSNGIEEYKPKWEKYYHPDKDTHDMLVWGFEELQDKYQSYVHQTCYTRPSCREDAQRLGVAPRQIHIDADPNKPKYLPALLDFLNDMWRMEQGPYVSPERTYPWHFLWVRKQSDLQTRLKVLRPQWNAIHPGRHLVNFVPGVQEESYFKDSSCLNVQRFVKRHRSNPAATAGVLDCFVLPNQQNEMMERAKISPDKVWIGKLTDESSGHGIQIYPGIDKLPKETTEKRLVQAYVEKPFLVDTQGALRKTDLRLYVVVTSFDPLRVYMHPAGQVKVAQSAYSNNFTNEFAHISNKVGSAGREYDTKDDELRKERQIDEFKFRLTLEDLANMMEPEVWRDAWEKTEDLMVRSVMTFADRLGCKSKKYPHTCGTAFQLLGVDVVYDERMQPYLMEINNDPGWNPYYEKRKMIMSTKGGTANGAACQFPFVHEGKKYIGQCAPATQDRNGLWCYTDGKGSWGFCDPKDESAHNKDGLQRVFNQVYGDLLHLTGAIPHNTDYERAVRARYDQLCQAAELPQACQHQEVREAVIATANEMENGGAFRLIFPQPNWRRKFQSMASHYDDTDLNDPGTLPDGAEAVWDIVTNYFTYDLQDAVLYRKKKKAE
eukprot:comp24193_c2_seq1/m.44374 comp24193_c2_seq1/g.44374  ORF comp24193_c2_seq1/g.44374 comp24193_c2_seq1/m.44374 type:complete len:984 (-) comp24193_c2_seq1:240-3191(-)